MATKIVERTMTREEAQAKIDTMNNRYQFFCWADPMISKSITKLSYQLLQAGWDVKEVKDETCKAGFHVELDLESEMIEDEEESEDEDE